MTPIISVIIPVYNTGTYLRRCVDSILPQLPDESEIIIVDDGSTDSSPAICDNIAASDRRITAIHTHNGGASHARNTGIEASRGRYTMMVDSDDTLEPDRIIPLINRMEAERLDLLTFGIYDIIDGKRRLSNVSGKPHSAVSGAEYALRHTIEHSPCTFIVLRKTIGDLRFQEGVIMEDYSFCLELYERCRLIAHSPDGVYNYIIRQGSVSRSRGVDADRHRMHCWAKILERMASRPWTETYRPAAQRWIAHYKLEAMKQLGHCRLSISERLRIRRTLRHAGIDSPGRPALPSLRANVMRMMLETTPSAIALWLICDLRRIIRGALS